MIMQKTSKKKKLSKNFDRSFLFTSFANYPLSFMSTTTAKKIKPSAVKHSPLSPVSFPVVPGSFGYHVTCQTYRQPRSQISLLSEKGSERTQFQASSITRIRRQLP